MSGSALLLAEVKGQGKAGVAAALSAIEENPHASAALALLDEAFQNPMGAVTGITGPPGAGKSTLIDVLIRRWRERGATVAVLAVDPSSRASKGALLGDRIRMRTDPADGGVFVRSLAARGRLGGLSDTAFPAAILLRALYDRVIVESVGVGQSETDIADISDTIVLLIQPGSGDSLQFMKAGIAEIPDIAIVAKADLGVPVAKQVADLKGALGLAHRPASLFEPLCLALSAATGAGVNDFLDALAAHEAWLGAGGRLEARRQGQARQWLEGEILAHFGRRGLEAARGLPSLLANLNPFAAAREALSRFEVVIHAEAGLNRKANPHSP